MITATTDKTKCDVRDCRNMAQYVLPCKGRGGKFFLCKQCAEKIADAINAERTPKSPKNAIKKMIDKKIEEMYE